MKIRLNNIRREFDKQYSLTKFAYLPVICESGHAHTKARYVVWLADYTEFYDIKTNKKVSQFIY